MNNFQNESWVFLKEVYDKKNLPNHPLPEFAFWGRSNVGKSSLINCLTKKKIAKTSKTPGRTRSIIFYELKNKFRLVDFPGYGFSNIPENDKFSMDKLISSYLTQENNLKKIFLLIDSRHGFKPIDNFILNNIEEISNKNIHIIFTKTDKLKKFDVKKLMESCDSKNKNKFHKSLFSNSIKQINGVVLLKKFLFRSL